jgi:hypothetical protein
MAINLDTLLIQTIIQIVVSIIVVAPGMWISGRLLVGKEKAKFTDAIWIAILGTVIGGIIQYFATGIIAWGIILIVWLAIVKHFFDCGWLRALIISIVAVLIFIAITIIIALIFGVALLGLVGLSGLSGLAV